MNIFKGAALLLVISAVSGCATKMSDMTEENSLTMKEIYNGSFNEVSSDAIKKNNKEVKIQKRIIHEGDTDLRDYTRTANNEHEVLFKRLKNPVLVGYVFAHLTKDNIPIPSYSIPFRMSPNDYYAMPGEDQSF